jgi:preprotein translocase subunit SecY
VKQYTRYITLAVAFVQSWITAQNLRPYCALGFEAKSYAVVATCLFTCGALAAAWLADEMTDRGLGQGTSVMITVSVCSAYVSALRHYASSLLTLSFTQILPFLAALTALVAGSVLVQTGTCRVPILYFQGPAIPGLPRVVREEIDHVPFKINPLGMQPVLVAVFLCEGAMWLANALSNGGTAWPEWVLSFVAALFSSASRSPAHYAVFFLIVFGFSYLDLQNTPKEVAEYMTKIGARVPNVRPGEQTARHLEELQRGSRFFGGLLLATVATACAFADAHMRRTTGICVGFTSMLIVTSTILQIKRQMSAMAQMPRLDKVMDGL